MKKGARMIYFLIKISVVVGLDLIWKDAKHVY